MKSNLKPLLSYAEYGAAALLTLAAFALHWQLYLNVGDPWRDEVSAIAVASMPGWNELWNSIRFDSSPFLYYALLHLWMGVFGDSTASIRTLGLGLGLGAVGAVWWLAARLRAGPPLLVLAMVALSAAVIRYGDSARAYGLGLLTAAFMLGALWTLMSGCSKKSIALAALSCLAAAHSSYQNSLLLFALGSAAIVASAASRQWRSAVSLLGICVLTAASLAIYLPALAYTKSLTIMFKWSISARDVFAAYGATVATGYADWQHWLWLGILLLALMAALFALLSAFAREASVERNQAMAQGLFMFLAIPFLFATYTVFMILSDYAVRPWYLLPLMLTLAAVAEAGVTSLPPSLAAGRAARIIVALVIGMIAIVQAPADLKRRATNMSDLIAGIEREGGPNDLVLLTDWTNGLTFNHLYRGSKQWMTIPDLGHHSVHRWDTLKERMQDASGITRELDKIQAALYAGHRVFVIGGFPRVSPQAVRTLLPPAPHPVEGWESGYYTGYWAGQAGSLLSSYATSATTVVPRGSQKDVMYWENSSLLVFSRTR